MKGARSRIYCERTSAALGAKTRAGGRLQETARRPIVSRACRLEDDDEETLIISNQSLRLKSVQCVHHGASLVLTKRTRSHLIKIPPDVCFFFFFLRNALKLNVSQL